MSHLHTCMKTPAQPQAYRSNLESHKQNFDKCSAKCCASQAAGKSWQSALKTHSQYTEGSQQRREGDATCHESMWTSQAITKCQDAWKNSLTDMVRFQNDRNTLQATIDHKTHKYLTQAALSGAGTAEAANSMFSANWDKCVAAFPMHSSLFEMTPVLRA